MRQIKVTPMQKNVVKATSKRILILGSAPHTQLVTAYTWDNLPQDLNVADYEVVILNLVALLTDEPKQDLNASEWDIDGLLESNKLSSEVQSLPSWRHFAHLLFSSDSEIIVIGRPQSPERKRYQSFYKVYAHINWWLPSNLKFTYDSGELISGVDPEFKYYFQQVCRWFFHINPEPEDDIPDIEEFLSLVNPKANKLKRQIRILAQTRYNCPIAFELRFKAVNCTASQVQVLQVSCPVFWLPEPTKISDYQAVNLILQERYGVQLEQSPPDWIEAYKLPNQIPIEKEICDYEQEIQRLKKESITVQERLQNTLRFRKLLYEQGIDGLEPVVRDALRELGATVEDPQPKANREDGRLTAPTGQRAMLEIKGRTKSLNLGDVRQLDHWVRDALIHERLKSKGILIANMYCGHPPEIRENPFPKNCVESAETVNLCLMTTTQLFRALCSHQRRELDLEEFWSAIFNTDGVCPLPELEEIDIKAFSEVS